MDSDPPLLSAAPDAECCLRVVSYDIRHGSGVDGVLDLERSAAVLRDLAPDLVALQEVDERVASDHRPVLAVLRQHAGANR